VEFLSLLILFYVISVILDRVRKAQGPQAPPRPGAPGRPVPQQRREPGPAQAGGPARSGTARPGPEADEPAAGMVPEDLWAILTGQRPPPARPRPSPEPEAATESRMDAPAPRPSPPPRTAATPAPARPSPRRWDTERTVRDVQGEIDRTLRRRQKVADRRLQVSRPERRVVSLTAEPPSDEERHAAFHAKIDAPRPAPMAPVRSRDVGVPRLDLEGPAALRRAVVLREVLGPPRALE
jgi:hypothetical protein